jgi:hypothetical protein
MGLRISAIRRYPLLDLRTVILGHRALGPLILASWLVLRFSGLDEGDNTWGFAAIVFFFSWIVGLGGATRLLLSVGPSKFRFRLPSVLLVASFILHVAGTMVPVPAGTIPGPLIFALRDAFIVTTLAAAALGAWAGWSTPIQG